MKRVYTDADPVRAGFVFSVLESAGVRCVTRNEYLGGGVGELPVNECWPEVWVLDEADAPRAERLIAHALSTASADAEPWVCARCGEGLEAQFSQCWRCGAER